ncbi:MAG: GNAT family N-acetyltransferase [Defluviitaleaceae bacterium]|nr:GNAT family N-acetyltransferase [Defluviitaleaceae bacterium]MCL2835993.1 GNAT family N-acetyltransferase [Defluviitaleaceae bacterium]
MDNNIENSGDIGKEERALPEVQLRPVDSHNWKACVDMSVTSAQEEFVSENWYSLLQWKFSERPENIYPYCIYSDGVMVGFIMYYLDPETHRWILLRFMIDAKHQGKGYGKAALLRLLENVRDSLGNIAFYTCVEPHNDVVIALYESVGFEKTGEVMSHEDVMRIIL